MSKQLSIDGVALAPLAEPTIVDAGSWIPRPSHLSLSPDKLISLYDDVQWEEFVREWATSLSYLQVMRSGGANDHGVDVAGFLTEQGFDGEWDCYQCKHYHKALLPSDAYPEILKVVLGTLDGHYTWPHRYQFAAPKGYGTTLSNVIHAPSKLRENLVKELRKDNSTLVKNIGHHALGAVLDFIAEADFSVFGKLELHDLVEQHGRTRWHAARFGVGLPPRPQVPTPATAPTDKEQRYIAKLLAAYAERHGAAFTHPEAAIHDQLGSHYRRQREAFYSAEALRVFARDSVPEGTFDALQQEIFDGVIDVHDLEYPDGMQRLHEVTRAAHHLAITANGLLPVVEIRDRTGICHHLANDDRLSWCDAAAQ